LADEAGLPWFQWFAARIGVLHALQDGRLDVAETLAGETCAFGERMDHPNVLPVFGAQMLHLQFLRGRYADAAATVALRLERVPGDRPARALLAHPLWHDGDAVRAPAELDRLAEHDFAALPRDGTWPMTGAYLAEVCAGLG